MKGIAKLSFARKLLGQCSKNTRGRHVGARQAVEQLVLLSKNSAPQLSGVAHLSGALDEKTEGSPSEFVARSVTSVPLGPLYAVHAGLGILYQWAAHAHRYRKSATTSTATAQLDLEPLCNCCRAKNVDILRTESAAPSHKLR